mmetsp:Transcript_73876/g.190675  ORF Transcript_73876/g.190675 Transcript_73876/m.190675 type:complete len:131 (+) Transcript_73876:185-577(+)
MSTSLGQDAPMTFRSFDDDDFLYESFDADLPTEPVEGELFQNGRELTMIHCLFAMVFAAATLGLLNCLGFIVRSGACCAAGQGYSACEVWQDFRSMLSFALGALLCCVLTRENKSSGEGAGKVHLYTCLL